MAIPWSSLGQPTLVLIRSLLGSASVTSSDQLIVKEFPLLETLYKRRILQYMFAGHALAPVPPPAPKVAVGALTAPMRPSGKFMIFEVSQPPPRGIAEPEGVNDP